MWAKPEETISIGIGYGSIIRLLLHVGQEWKEDCIMAKQNRKHYVSASVNAVNVAAAKPNAAEIREAAMARVREQAARNIGVDSTGRVDPNLWDQMAGGTVRKALQGAMIKMACEVGLMTLEEGKDSAGCFKLTPTLNLDLTSAESRAAYHAVFEDVFTPLWRAAMHEVGHRVPEIDAEGNRVLVQGKDRNGALMTNADGSPRMFPAYKKDDKGRDLWEGTRALQGYLFDDQSGLTAHEVKCPTFRHVGALQNLGECCYDGSPLVRGEDDQRRVHRESRRPQVQATRARGSVSASALTEATGEDIAAAKAAASGFQVGIVDLAPQITDVEATREQFTDKLGRKRTRNIKRGKNPRNADAG